jgi:replication factor A1
MMSRLITLQDHNVPNKKVMHFLFRIHIFTYRFHACFLLNTCRGSTIDLSLSGQRAIEFNAEAIFDISQNHHAIAIFVGTLMKIYREDYKFLSGTSACRWYINENDIPAMRTFQRGYCFQF